MNADNYRRPIKEDSGGQRVREFSVYNHWDYWMCNCFKKDLTYKNSNMNADNFN